MPYKSTKMALWLTELDFPVERWNRLSPARRRLVARYGDLDSSPAVASHFISRLSWLDKKRVGWLVVLYLRVSGREQHRRGRLWVQRSVALRLLQGLRFEVIAVFEDVASGWRDDREKLQAAVKKAQTHGAILVALSTDRFLRSVWFKTTTAPDAQPTVWEFKDFARTTHGVTLATVLDPDMPWREVHGFVSQQGQMERGNKGGRPREAGYMKRRRHRLAPWVIELFLKWQSLPSEIEEETSVPKSTVRRWLRPYIGRNWLSVRYELTGVK